MKLFFDSNVILDALSQRDTNYRSSRRLIMEYVASGFVKGYISSKQITDIYYTLRHYCSSEEERREMINVIIDTFEILPTTKSDIKYCVNSDFPDIEDALIDEICSVYCIKYLVTNDKKGFKKAKSTVFTPEEILSLLDAGLQ